MSNLVQFKEETAGGLAIAIEVDEDDMGAGPVDVSLTGEGVVATASRTFSDALDTVKAISESIIEKLDALPRPPKKAEVEFGLSLKGDLGFYVVKGTAEGNFKIKMTWEK